MQNFFPVVVEQPVLWGKNKNIKNVERYKAPVESQKEMYFLQSQQTIKSSVTKRRLNFWTTHWK
jgi:hypothetical protein